MEAEIYISPSEEELNVIENEFSKQGVEVIPLCVDIEEFNEFKRRFKFPEDFYEDTGVREEKILEHYLSFKLLKMENWISDSVYIDIAAADSPWAKIIRDVYNGKIRAYALDLKPSKKYGKLDYYLVQNATRTSFHNESVDGVSLQCAYEMFMGDDDINLIFELNRILKHGGKGIILPLYMHTHDCHYTSPEFYGRGMGDLDSKEYIRWDCWGIPSSRKYSVRKLKTRILDLVKSLDMDYKIYVLRTKKETISPDVYLHFILEIQK